MKTLILTAILAISACVLPIQAQQRYERHQEHNRSRVQFHISFGQRHRYHDYDRGMSYSRLEVRYEHYYGHEYRVTYRVTYLPNGQTETRVIERVQVY